MRRCNFEQLKVSFTTAPILWHPDPELLFILEVDASNCGIGAILSHGTPRRVYPCAFISWKLTPAESNYDVGNKELLSIKAALEEWCYWMEGAIYQFMVLIEHQNLEYLCSARRLNLCQARWAFFFTRFQYIVSNRPGSKNGKADALSWRNDTPSTPTCPEPILQPSTVLTSVQWNLEGEIWQTHADEPPPPTCHRDRLYVPMTLCPWVMQWVHEGSTTQTFVVPPH